MAPKKKRKPISNPARGVATTSIISKAKIQEAAEKEQEIVVDAVATEEDSTVVTTAKDVQLDTNSPKKEEKQTAEEYERELEETDLLMFHEKNKDKIHRDAQRTITRLETDKRTLRSSLSSTVINLNASKQITDLLLKRILALELEDVQRSDPPKLISNDESTMTLALWQLHRELSGLGFSENHIEKIFENHITSVDDALEWASLRFEEEDLPSLNFDQRQPATQDITLSVSQTVSTTASRESSRPVSPVSQDQPSKPSDKVVKRTPRAAGTTIPTKAEAQLSDTSSDSESANDDEPLDPDSLVSLYLKYMKRTTRLASRLPSIANRNVSALKKPNKKNNTSSLPVAQGNSPLAKRIQKINARIERITTDVLFDRLTAEALWANEYKKIKKHELDLIKNDVKSARTSEEKQNGSKPTIIHTSRGTLSTKAAKQLREASSNPAVKSQVPVVPEAAKSEESEQDTSSDSESDTDLTAGLFEQKGDIETVGNPDSTTTRLHIKQYGKGGEALPHAQRLLQDMFNGYCSGTKMKLVDISGPSCNYRSQVTINWPMGDRIYPIPKDITPSEDEETEKHFGRISIASTRSIETSQIITVIQMVSVACPSSLQAQNYICTIALYSIFPDTKSYVRLTNVWKSVWSELIHETNENKDAEERIVLKRIRSMTQNLLEKHKFEDIIKDVNTRMESTTMTEPGTLLDLAPIADDEISRAWEAKSNSPAYQKMLKSGREMLPMWNFKDTVLSAIQREPVIIICGETGCGKSTQVPSFILEHEMAKGNSCKIYCTEPRRISAISLARRVSAELGERPNEIGVRDSLVGYAIRLESKIGPSTRLVYATTGIVMRMLERNNDLGDITHLVLDEVHERTIESDFLLIVLKKLLLKRRNLKVILMSATVDAMKFSKYLDGAPILNVPGRTFPVQTLFLEDAVELTGFEINDDGYRKKYDNDEDEQGDEERDEAGTAMVTFDNYSTQTQKTMKKLDEWVINYDLIVELLLKIAQNSEYQFYSKAILVFLPGLAEIRKLNDMLLGHPFFHGFKNNAPGGKWVVYPLHSTIASEDQEQAFLVPPHGTRKIVLATNIAETGITIPDITCVIDSVKHKEMRFDEKKQLSRLISTFISKANAKQRRGRAGRVQNGLCFHLITKNRHDAWLKDQQEPEMLRLSLQDLILRVKICKLGGIEDTLSQALDAPTSKSIRRAMESLIETKALTSSEELTALGRQLAKLPLDVYLGKLLLLGCMHQCIDVAVTIAAIISSKSPFITPFGQRAEADAVKLGYRRGDSDLLTTWNAYLAWRRVTSSKTMNEYDFCRRNFLSSRTLSNIEDLKQQLFVSLLDAKFITLDEHHRHNLMQARFNGGSSSSGRHYHRHFFLLPENLDKNSLTDNLVVSIIATAFYPKLLAKDGKNSWRNIVNNQKIGIHPSSVNKRHSNMNKIHWLSYYNIMQANKFYDAHETSAVDHLAVALLCGDAEFKMYSGAMIIDGHRVRFTFDTWKMTAAVRVLRARIREMNHRAWKQPGRVWTEYETRWRDLVNVVLSRCGNHNTGTQTNNSSNSNANTGGGNGGNSGGSESDNLVGENGANSGQVNSNLVNSMPVLSQ